MTPATADPIDRGLHDVAAPDPIDRGLRDVAAAAEALAAALDLRPQPVPAPLRRLDGEVRGAPVALHTRRFAGPAWSLTLAEIVAADATRLAVTAIGMPTDTPAPILGLDLVAVQGALSLVAVDLAPTDDAAWAAHAAPALDRLHAALAGLVVARRWPAFAAEVFSPKALIAGVHRGHEPAVLAAIAAFIPAVAPIVAATTPTPDPHAVDRRRRWCLAERRNRREHDALARMFGADKVAPYIDFLFPAN